MSLDSFLSTALALVRGFCSCCYNKKSRKGKHHSTGMNSLQHCLFSVSFSSLALAFSCHLCGHDPAWGLSFEVLNPQHSAVNQHAASVTCIGVVPALNLSGSCAISRDFLFLVLYLI